MLPLFNIILNIQWPKWYKILSIILILTFGIIYIYIDNKYSNEVKESGHNFRYSSISGEITYKCDDNDNIISYYDAKSCSIKNYNGFIYLKLDFDNSGFFNYISIGDSVYKEYNDQEITVKKENETKAFLINY